VGAEVRRKRLRRADVGCGGNFDRVLKLVSEHRNSCLAIEREAEHGAQHPIRRRRRQKVEAPVDAAIANRPHRHVDDDVGVSNHVDECPECLGSAHALRHHAPLEASGRADASNRIGGWNV
jgi:hypothetical protein